MKMLHEWLVWKISTGGASPQRGAVPWRSYSYQPKLHVHLKSMSTQITKVVFLFCIALSKKTRSPCQPKVQVNLKYLGNFACLYCIIETKPQVHFNLKSMSYLSPCQPKVHVNLKSFSTLGSCQPKVHVNLEYVGNFACLNFIF